MKIVLYTDKTMPDDGVEPGLPDELKNPTI